MQITKLPVGFLETNCYLLTNPDSRKALLIDPGDEAKEIEKKINSLGANVYYILLTHGHPDHYGAALQLAQKYSAPILIHPNDAKLFNLKMDQALADGDFIQLEEIKLEVIHTQGHTPGSVCFKTEEVIFTGDTLFCGGVGRTDLPGGDQEKLKVSLEKIKLLPGKLQVYPGHGEDCLLIDEFKDNPFLSEEW